MLNPVQISYVYNDWLEFKKERRKWLPNTNSYCSLEKDSEDTCKQKNWININAIFISCFPNSSKLTIYSDYVNCLRVTQVIRAGGGNGRHFLYWQAC